MKKPDYNEIARYEIAISKKYGKEATQHPKAEWSDKKEQSYQEQIRDLYQKEKRIDEKNEKIEIDGVLISKKLFNKDSNRNCPVCGAYSFELRDDVGNHIRGVEFGIHSVLDNIESTASQPS